MLHTSCGLLRSCIEQLQCVLVAMYIGIWCSLYTAGHSHVAADCSGKPRGYAFIEYEHKNNMKEAYKRADGKKVEGKRVVVDVERGRTVPNWYVFPSLLVYITTSQVYMLKQAHIN